MSTRVVSSDDDDFFQSLRTEIPCKPDDLEDIQTNYFTFKEWRTALLYIFVSLFIIVFCMYYIFRKIFLKRLSRRHQSLHGALSSTTLRTVVTFQTNHNVNTGVGNLMTGTGNVHRGGAVNFSFSSISQSPESPLETENHRSNPVPSLEMEDRPPEYSTVVLENTDNDGTTNTLYSQVSEAQKVERPPPAYITVAPFNTITTIKNSQVMY